MSRTWAIAWRELRSYFVSPIAYVVLAGFGIITGWIFFNLLSRFLQISMMYRQFNPQMMERLNLHDMVLAPTFLNMTVFLLILFPVITMRVIAEERRQGTDELLLTAPIGTWQIVLGKFIAVFLFFVLMIAVTLPFAGVLIKYGNPAIGEIVSAYVGLLFMGAAFASVGTFTSALTRNQIIAAVSCFVVLLMIYVIDWIATSASGNMREVLEYVSLIRRYEDFVKGVVDVKNIVYFSTFSAFSLYLAKATLDTLRLR